MVGDGMARHPGRSKIGWGFFGAELRRSREAAGLTQQELGERVFCSGSYIGQFEAAVRKPQRDVAQRIDAELGTDGLLTRMCEELINNSPFADYFADAAELERFAVTITEYAPQLVPGLMQTEAYARAVFRAAQPLLPEDELNALVATRLERASILRDPQRPTRPLLWIILDETVIRRPVGGPAAMCGQLAHVARLVRAGRVIVQVLPFSAGAHALMEGLLQIMTFQDAPPVAYVEGPYTGQLLDDPSILAKCQLSYDLIRAAALPCDASLALIESVTQEYGEHDH